MLDGATEVPAVRLPNNGFHSYARSRAPFVPNKLEVKEVSSVLNAALCCHDFPRKQTFVFFFFGYESAEVLGAERGRDSFLFWQDLGALWYKLY